MGQTPLFTQNAPLSLSTWANTSKLHIKSVDKMPLCKTIELLYKWGLKHKRLGTFSHMVTVTVSLFSTHLVTVPCRMLVIAKK